MTTATFILALAVLAATATLFCACLRLQRLAEFALATYVIGFAEVVALSLVVSPFHLLTRGALLTGLGIGFAAALSAWLLCGKPAPPHVRPALAALRRALRDPVIAVLALAVVCGLVYVAGLTLFTPPNDFDALWYHLPRAALWKQQHAVAFVERANDHRINATQPDAEIAVAFGMILDQSERFVGLVQFMSLLAAMLAIGAVARRIGLDQREALFGALAFATLPVVALQASTALNDIVVASLLVGVLAFVCCDTRAGWALAAIALGLAIGTKPTAVLALPVIAAAALFVHTPRRWVALMATGLAGLALGSVWWLVNLVKTGEFDADTTAVGAAAFAVGHAVGGIAGDSGAAHRAPVALLTGAVLVMLSRRTRVVLLAALAAAVLAILHILVAREEGAPSATLAVALLARRAIDAIDPSGGIGTDRFIYAVAAAALLAGGALASMRRRPPEPVIVAIAAAAIALLPLVLDPLHNVLLRGYQKTWLLLGHPDLAFLGYDRHDTRVSPFQSWYGPLGLLLFLAALALVVRELRRRGLPAVALLLASAPLLFLPVMSVTISYSYFDGRYFMFSVALAASTWGLVLRVRLLAWAASAVAVSSLALSLVHYYDKPSGIGLLSSTMQRSVWGEPRWRVLSLYTGGASAAQRTLDELSRPGATIGLRIRAGDLSYPYFGRHLDRVVRFVGPAGEGLERADWLVLAPGKRTALCPSDWTRVQAWDEGWELYRRSARGSCGQLR